MNGLLGGGLGGMGDYRGYGGNGLQPRSGFPGDISGGYGGEFGNVQPVQVMPGAYAAASSGMNAPSQDAPWWQNMFASNGTPQRNPGMMMLGQMGQQMMRRPQQGILSHPMMGQQPYQPHPMQQMGALYMTHPSRIF